MHLNSDGYLKLGEVCGDYSIWGHDFLPAPGKKTERGVLDELLRDPDDRGYHNHITSLQNYRHDYAGFSAAYYSTIHNTHPHPTEFTCVPYWGSEFWKSPSRMAVFAQKSLNKDGASIPLYLPLCETGNWEAAFCMGRDLGKWQQKSPFSWQSFMSVWIAMRVLFSQNPDVLQRVYYSDLRKLTDDSANQDLLGQEIDITRPGAVLILGKTAYDQYRRVFEEAGVDRDRICYICFPCGQGAVPKHDPRAETLLNCRKRLQDYFESCHKA